MTDSPIWITNPKYDFIKIANPAGEAELYGRHDYNDGLSTGEGYEMKCAYSSCPKLPQTVCRACTEYVCEEHLYRHPNCEDGR